MLVLNRKTNESIVLNNVIKVTVLSVEGDRVKLGIQAPPDVLIVREELLTRQAPTMPAPLPPLDTTVVPIFPTITERGR